MPGFRLLVICLLAGCALPPPQQATSAEVVREPVQLVQVTLRSRPGDIRGGAFDYLIKTLAEYTTLDGIDAGSIPLDDPALLDLPWIRMPSALGTTVLSRDLTSAERANLGLLLSGGSLLVAQLSGRVEQLRGGLFDMYRQALAEQGLHEGSDWRFTWLDEDHPVFHGLFDFTPDSDIGLLIHIDGRDHLAALMTRLPLLTDRAWVGTGRHAVDGTRFLQFTANTVIYAVQRAASAKELQ